MSENNKFIVNKKTKRIEIKNNLNYINFKFLNNLTRNSFDFFDFDNTFIVF